MVKQGISAQQIERMSKNDLDQIFPYHGSGPDKMYVMPDLDSLTDELCRPGVTIELLWDEYVEACRDADKIPYRLTQFKHYLHEHRKR